MTPHAAAVENGRTPYHGLFLLLMILMAALIAGRSLTRTDPIDAARSPEDPQERGAHYEDHVLAGGRLFKSIGRRGSTLQHHARIFVPRHEIPARYYAVPKGYAGGAHLDETPHSSAARTWASVGPGGYRIPDAMETRTDGTQILYELKCPSPWLTFDRGSAWASGMQTAFASQALAYFLWAKADPPRRRVVYGFCGWTPPWAQAILNDLEARYGITADVRDTFLAVDFKPAERLVGRPVREFLTAGTMEVLADLAPGEVLGPVFDLRKD